MRVTIVTLFLAAAVSAQDTGLKLKQPAEIDWKASGSMPPGTEYHLIYEDAQTHAVQTLVRLPADYAMPSHFHTHDETIVVVKGKLAFEKDGHSTVLLPGAYAVVPAGAPHSLKTKGWGPCEMIVSLNGPFDVKGLPNPK